MDKIRITVFCAALCACLFSFSSFAQAGRSSERTDAKELFFSDSLNARGTYRTYPVPNVTYSPVPEGYEPVYVTSYARHGSRELVGKKRAETALHVLEKAAKSNHLTPLGEEVLAKVSAIDKDLKVAHSDLTTVGEEQHKGIAERMYRNYENVFVREGTPVRLYSTFTQRTMMSMFSANESLLRLNPTIVSTRLASNGLTYLVKHIPDSAKENIPKDARKKFLKENFDARPLLSRLFTNGAPALKDTMSFVNNLYECAAITAGLDLKGVEFMWDVFTYDELYTICQAINYNWYVSNSNSTFVGDYNLEGICPLLRDFIDKADAALASDVPGADLRFGHDSHLSVFCALIGLNGFVPQETNPLKVIDIYQTFVVVPMAGNVQMVFYRNPAGDVIVKLLQNEVEAFVPIETDIYPYYHWNDLRAYFKSRLATEYVNEL